MDSADINDHLPTSSPSGKTVVIIFGGLVGFLVLVVLVSEFRNAWTLDSPCRRGADDEWACPQRMTERV
jgi:hypothetical protein